MTSRSYVLFAACLGLMGALLSGCSASLDAHTYESTPMLPMTVTVVDSTTGESLWAMDVPVNQKLRVRFYDDRRPDDVSGNRTAMMRWELTSTDKSTGKLRNEIAVPQAHSRRIDVTLRDIPEYATSGAYVPPTTNSAPPPSTGEMLPSETRPRDRGGDNPPSLDPVVIPDRDDG